MAATIPTTTTDLLRAQLAALESMYATERRCETARRILDLIHMKRDELSVAIIAAERAELDQLRAA